MLSEFEIPEVWFICLIQNLLGINHMGDLRTHKKLIASWKCGDFTACKGWSVLWIMCEKPGMCQIPVWICADFVQRFFSCDFWKSLTDIQNCSSLDFSFFLCLTKSGCMGTMCVILWLPVRNQAQFSKPACCYFWFLIFTIFCRLNYFNEKHLPNGCLPFYFFFPSPWYCVGVFLFYF